MLEMRSAIHLNFDRNGDLLFHFLRRSPGPLCNHLHPRIRHIRIRFDRQSFESDNAPHEKNRCHTQNDEAIVEGIVDNRSDHYCSAVFWNSSAFAITCCPGAIPDLTSCMSPGSIAPAFTSTRRKLLPPAGT